MRIEVLADAGAVAREAAAVIAEEARAAVRDRGRFVLAVSGGHTPWIMLRALAGEDVPWQGIHVVQVATALGLTDSAVRGLLYRARTKLRRRDGPVATRRVRDAPRRHAPFIV